MRTRFVKSDSELSRLQAIYAAPAFLDIRSLAFAFESDPAVLAELLPPPLEPAADPTVSVSLSEIRRSNCVGAFNGCSLNIACSFEGARGLYCLTMPTSTDTAVIFGRELYAEPKKLANIVLDVRFPHVRGTVTRHGVTYIELQATFDDAPAVIFRETTSSHYYFKFLPAADGNGLAFDPELVRVTHRGRTRRSAQGTGTLTFRESIHDPVIDIPVVNLGPAVYSESDTFTTAEVVGTVPASQFLPYAFGKSDDLTVWEDIGNLAPA